MVAELLNPVGNVVGRCDARQRNATPQALRCRDDVRDNPEVLHGEPSAGPADARLRLVDNHEHAMFRAPFTDGPNILSRWHDHAANTHDYFKNEGGRRPGRRPVDNVHGLPEEAHVRAVFPERIPIGVRGWYVYHTGQAAARDAFEFASQARDREAAMRHAMVSAHERHDLGAPRVDLRNPQRGLCGFRTGAGKVRALEAWRHDLRQPLCQQDSWRIGIARPRLDELCRLVGDRLRVGGMAMSSGDAYLA